MQDRGGEGGRDVCGIGEGREGGRDVCGIRGGEGYVREWEGFTQSSSLTLTSTTGSSS